MSRDEIINSLQSLRANEHSRIEFNPHKTYKVGLVYPNTYFVGMSNLGMQIIYEEINDRPTSCAERYFLPVHKDLAAYKKYRLPLMSVETQRPLQECHVVGVDITFEMDYFNIPEVLTLGRIPVLRKHRIDRDPIVIAGGPCATFNPEPISDFFDAFIIGEGEGLISDVLDVVEAGREQGLGRAKILENLHYLKGVYVPKFYTPLYDEDGRFDGFDAAVHTEDRDFNEVAAHSEAKNIEVKKIGVSKEPSFPMVHRHWRELEIVGETVVHTDFTEFGAMYIVEVARGCGRHCRFCMAGYCFRRPRVRPLEDLKLGVDRAAELGKKVGLMGAAISDYPYIDELVQYIRSKGLRFSCASLRADSLTQDVVDGLAASGQQTITVAPEAGSERLRRVINKGITDESLFKAVDLAAKAGIPHIRLYIMVGLPTEVDEDIEAIVNMAEAVYDRMQMAGCKGRLTLSVNPFIPKPFTPFQWMPMANQKDIRKKLNYIKKSLQKNHHIEVLVESPREAYVQAVLARGDRRLGAVILEAVKLGGPKNFKAACKTLGYDMEDELYRERPMDAKLPWSMLSMGLDENYLANEWHRSVSELYTAPCMDGCQRCGVCRDIEKC